MEKTSQLRRTVRYAGDGMSNGDGIEVLKRVVIVGAESTGKSTLTEMLAQHFSGATVPEFARTYFERGDTVTSPEDLREVARGQVDLEESAIRAGARVLICDTNPLVTMAWSKFLFGVCHRDIVRLVLNRHYDHYLVANWNVPWVDDGIRKLSGHESRLRLQLNIIDEIDRVGAPFTVLQGSWEERNSTAVSAIAPILRSDRRAGPSC